VCKQSEKTSIKVFFLGERERERRQQHDFMFHYTNLLLVDRINERITTKYIGKKQQQLRFFEVLMLVVFFRHKK
jgi:hypothetical protein